MDCHQLSRAFFPHLIRLASQENLILVFSNLKQEVGTKNKINDAWNKITKYKSKGDGNNSTFFFLGQTYMKGTSPTHIFTSMITHEEKLPQGPTLIISHDSSFFFRLPLIHVPIQVDPGAHASGVGLKSSCHGPLDHCSKVCFGGLQNRPRTHRPCIYRVFLSLSKHAVECVMFWKMVGTCTCGWLE